MITKAYIDGSSVCRATFHYEAPIGVNSISVCGDFNRWTPGVHELTRDENGVFTATLPLAVGERFHFKYLLDNGEWHNDHQADAYEPNEWGAMNSVLDTGTPTSAADAIFPPPVLGVVADAEEVVVPLKPKTRKATAPAAQAARKASSPAAKSVAPKKAAAKKAPKKAAQSAPKKAAKKAAKAKRPASGE